MKELRPPRCDALPAALLGTLVVLGSFVWWTHHSTSMDVEVVAATEGVFIADGIVPSRLGSPDGARYWSSWQDNDANTGHLRLGPLPAPRTLGFFAAGYLQAGGNRLWFENAVTGEAWEPAMASPGEAWSPVVVDLPPTWVGQPLVIHALDNALEPKGWLAVAEPFSTPRSASWWNGGARKVGAFLFLGLILGLAAAGASSVCRGLGFSYEPANLLLSCALLALSGYGIFWLTWLHATLGAVAAWVELLIAGGLAFWRGNGNFAVWRQRDWRLPAVLMVGVGLVYCAGLLWFEAEPPMGALAEIRFSEGLPEDNLLPQRFAERLAQGLSPKHLVGGWRSSDRPPLQAGWVLLLMRPARGLGVDYDTVGQCAGIWAQLLWVPGVWLLLRSLKTSPGVASWVVVGLLPTGFLFLNSTFVWPKLLAAALVVGAFVLWFLVSDADVPRTLRHVGGGVLAALGWLAHGGVAFAFIALAPFALWSWRDRGRIRPWALAGVVFVLLALPWLAYQKWYEPPGNQLVRWHLAGEQTPDKRGTWESLADAYRRITFDDWWRGRCANARLLFAGEWRSLWQLDFSNPEARRRGESFVFSVLGWWNVGWPALLLAWGVRAWRRSWTLDAMQACCAALAWVFLTLVAWVILMFIGGTTLVHQGSYTTLLVLLPVLALASWRLHRWLFFALVAIQAWGFGAMWLVAPAHLGDVVRPIDVAVVGLIAVAVCVVVAWQGWVADRRIGLRGE